MKVICGSMNVICESMKVICELMNLFVNQICALGYREFTVKRNIKVNCFIGFHFFEMEFEFTFSMCKFFVQLIFSTSVT